ncbi:MFS transporter [Phenylobacterium sp. LH3H17]|uniref:MFS transporter n=1 Tax=Phenylobacterium sp. LH3H17 TaxID=2903901 RepID=UPI0020C99655|nr:MFS transporter [Phenylobacterium sp. LH3H17]UTP38309.1 MFS transporter [Phenylobacterium sp. LH3H17]
MKAIGAAASAAYASGSFGTGVFSTVPTVLLLYFCTETLKIPPGWAAAIVFIPKAWAIFWDPLVGSWSDGSVSPLGRRRPFLAVGAIGVVVAFVALFTPPVLPGWGEVAWVGCCYFALAALYSIFAVPYIAIPAEIGEDEASRARLVAWRIVVAMVGVLAGASAAPLIVEAGGGGRAGYAVMALVIAAACGLAMAPPFLMMAGRDQPRERPSVSVRRPGLTAQMKAALQNSRFRNLLAAYVLQLTAVGLVTSAAPYLVVAIFSRPEGDTGLAMGAMLLATIVSVPFWTALARRIGEARAYVGATLAFGLVTALLGVGALAGAPWGGELVAFALIGLPFGGLQVLPFTLVAHLIHGDAGAQAEATFTGVWTSGEKLGLAFGPALTGLALASAGGHMTVAVVIFLTVAPGALCLVSLHNLRSAGLSRRALEPAT